MQNNAQKVKPPSSNTGAQITNACKEVLIDWLAFTLKNPCPENAVRLLGLNFDNFTLLERGGMGYKQSLRFGHITVYFDGTENMGCHVEISGKGCKQLTDSGHSLKQILTFILINKGNLTRLDIAVDTYDESLELSEIKSAVKSGQVRTHFRTFRTVTSSSITPDGLDNSGQTYYFGSGQSRCQFRIYDKQAEQKTDYPWIRFEIQLRDERADHAAIEIIKDIDLGFIVHGIINQYLAFINLDDSNKSRCTLKSWWSAWLDHTIKLKITLKKAIKTITDVQEWLSKQYSPTLAMLKKALNPYNFHQFLNQLCTEGTKRLKPKHQQMIDLHNIAYDYPF